MTKEQLAEQYAGLNAEVMTECDGVTQCDDKKKLFDAFIAGYEAAELKWISVQDELPEHEKGVLVLLESETVLIGTLFSNGWSVLFSDGEKAIGQRIISHWMPLPKNPQTK